MKAALQHLRDEWFRYLFEALAIVVGVLGAFGLNHWNDTRKRAAVEREVLEQVAADLERTVASVEACAGTHGFIIERAERLLDHMAGSEPYADGVGHLLAEAFFYSEVEIDLGGYKTMQSHGVDVVSDRELRNRIIHHFERRVASMKRREGILYAFADRVKLEEAADLFEYAFGVEGYEVDGELAESWRGVQLSSVPRDYEVLRRHDRYRYQVRTYMETVKWFDLSMRQFGDRTAELVAAIESELGER